MKQTKPILKEYFETGKKPTESQFGELIDSYHHIDSGVIVTDVAEDQEGNKTISLSDGTAITINTPTASVDQNNTVRVVDLGIIAQTQSNIEDDVISIINKLNPPLVVGENENIIFEFDIKKVEEEETVADS